MNSKICTKCNENKDITAFSKCRSRRDGLQQYCKACNKKDNDGYRKEKLLKFYEEEMAANLNLYISGKDDSAYQRYETLRNYVATLRTK